MSVGDSVQLACRDSLLPFLQQEARAAGGGGSGGGGGAGSDGGELKLLEVDESMLAELLSDGWVESGEEKARGEEEQLVLRGEKSSINTVQIGDTWRGVDPAYLASLLHLLLLTAAANDWPPRAIPEAATVAAMCGEGGKGEAGKTEGGERMRGEGEGEEGEGERREGPRAELVRHCLKVFGKRRRKGRREEWEEARSVRVGGSGADDGGVEDCGKGEGGEGGGMEEGECVWWELDERKVCRHYARQLLESGTPLPTLTSLPLTPKPQVSKP
ncbi:unnamed protein product [Closterium sp. Naga37s-1]|nr:unnamed protein product [Closterium sp. Naga37s-1]